MRTKSPLSLKQKTAKLGKDIATVISLTDLKKRQKKHLRELLEKTDDAQRKLKSITRATKQHEAIYAGLEQLKNLNDIPEALREIQLISILTKELARLEQVSSSQRELLQKTAFHNPLVFTESPILKKSFHPLTFVKSLKTYQQEKKLYKRMVRETVKATTHVVLDATEQSVEISRDGSKHYKAEHLTQESNMVKVGDTYVSTYYVSDLPRILYPQTLYKLLTSSLPLQLSIFAEPVDNGKIIKQIRSRLATLETQQRERMEKGKIRNHKIDKGVEEMTTLADELVHELEKVLLVSLYITLEAKSKEELQTFHETLKNITDTIELFTTKYTYGQKKAFESILPFNTDLIKQQRILQSSALSYLTPFITKHLYNPNGILLGVNTRQEGLLFVDPFMISQDPMRNSNMNILGVSGSGKSVTSKTIATRLYMKGVQIIVIDPEGEYLDYAKAMGGEIIQFSRTNGINPFSIYSNDRNDILDHILVLKSFFKFFIRADRYDATILDTVLVSLYQDYPTIKPTFKVFLKLLKNTPMYDDIAVLDKGSLQGVFNSQRELELTNDLVVFDISPLKDTEMKAPAMYLLTSLIWQLVDKQREKRKMLFIDEAHNLLVDREVAVFYRKIVKEARKRNLGVVSITQNVEDFLGNEWGNGIITNSETKILLKQSFASLPLMEKIAPMTMEEKMMLGNLPVGEFVLIREQEHIHASMHVLPFETNFVYTTPGEQH